MYVITRADLPVATQAVQAAHAAMEFTRRYRRFVNRYHNGSLFILAAPDEPELWFIRSDLTAQHVRHVIFTEPRLHYQVTAVAWLLGANQTALRYPLAFQENNHADPE